uniref:Uncharacterized protein n=1 Tax=Anopheles albimanus TaxID=7167 RepID=A0A182F479_ANOAL
MVGCSVLRMLLETRGSIRGFRSETMSLQLIGSLMVVELQLPVLTFSEAQTLMTFVKEHQNRSNCRCTSEHASNRYHFNSRSNYRQF